MKEAVGDLWTYPADARCVTTNGVVSKRTGELVMGKGVALEAARRYPSLPRFLALSVKISGNVPVVFRTDPGVVLISFPTKKHWRNGSDIALIERSAKKIAELVNSQHLGRVVLPRPGCGCGGLRWEQVRKVLEPILDDRFTVVHEE